MVIYTRISFQDWLQNNKLTPLRKMPTLQDLHWAIRINDVAQVKQLVQSSALNINSSLLSCTALSLAVYRSTEEMILILLRADADPNKMSCDWNQRIEPPLSAACRLSKDKVAETLLRYGSDPNATDFNQHTPIWMAVRERNLSLVQLLIDYEAKLDWGDRWAQCPLYMATKYFGREKIAALLIRHGCSVDCLDREGYGTFYWALLNGQFGLVELLLDAGVHISSKLRQRLLEKNTLIDSLVQKPEEHANLRRRLTNVKSLSGLCACAVRSELRNVSQGCTIWPLVDQLPVSAVAKEKLKLLRL